MRFDDAPERFRSGHAGDQFSGASGVLFEQAMAQTRMAICLCDPNQPDLPIVFANRAFRRLTGYSEEEIVGRNCRFLQGPKTDPEPITRIREAIANEDVVVVELLNYRKNGTTFWNALHLGPIYNDKGELVYFFGSQWDVSDVRAARAEERHAKEMARELSHRMKNMFAVISGIVNVTGRVRGIQGEAAEINSRIQALGRAYETTLDDASSGSIDIGEAIRAREEAALAAAEGAGEAGEGPQIPSEATVETPQQAVPLSRVVVQFATPDAMSFDAALSGVRETPGVRALSVTSTAMGGTSVMSVSFSGTASDLAAALRGRGFRVNESGNTLAISR